MTIRVKLEPTLFDELNTSNFINITHIQPSRDSIFEEPYHENRILEIFPEIYKKTLQIILNKQIQKSLFDSLEKVSIHMYERYEGSIYYDDWMEKGKLPTFIKRNTLLSTPNDIANKIINASNQVDKINDRVLQKMDKKKRTKKDDEILNNDEERLINYKNQLKIYSQNLLETIQEYELVLGDIS